MAVPKKRTSSSKRNQRRAHDGLKSINISFHPDSGEPMLSHRIAWSGDEGLYKKFAYRRKAKKAEELSAEFDAQPQA